MKTSIVLRSLFSVLSVGGASARRPYRVTRAGHGVGARRRLPHWLFRLAPVCPVMATLLGSALAEPPTIVSPKVAPDGVTFAYYEPDAFSVSVTDTTGAGDAFHGAFALMVAEGRQIADCARIAAAVAALKCTRLGSRAGLPTRPELDAYLAGMKTD